MKFVKSDVYIQYKKRYANNDMVLEITRFRYVLNEKFIYQRNKVLL